MLNYLKKFNHPGIFNSLRKEVIAVIILVLVLGAGLLYLTADFFDFDFFIFREEVLRLEEMEDKTGLDLSGVSSSPGSRQLEEFFRATVQPGDLQPGLRRPLAVVIENHPSSRPQTGLNEADLVYEFLVEGGITRFLAFYFSRVPQEIGPIRSLRSYMVETASGYDSRLLHIGASPLGYQYLSQLQVENYDEISRGSYYWRESDRSRPHNVYTGSDSLPQHVREKYFAVLPAANPAEEKTSENRSEFESAPEIEIRYWGGYTVCYHFAEESGAYLRYLGDASRPHLDTTGKQLAAENIIVKYVPTRVIDDVGRLRMELDSQGELLFFQKGTATSGYWLKDSQGETEYYNRKGEPLEFLPGRTWIQVVPLNAEINY